MHKGPLLTGICGDCGASLGRALVREIRHYEETRLLEVMCGLCERRFMVIDTVDRRGDALQVEDVVAASAKLAAARSLADLFDGVSVDFPDAA